jgi:predicted  nucleic acid-binding Zn-ribbon protein
MALQSVDSSIQEEEKQIAGVPAAVTEVDARIQEHKDRLAARNQQLEEARKERRTLEGELQSINDKLSKYQDQLMQVKTNDAYTAMLREIDGTKKDIAKHEEKILEDMLAVDELAAEIAELEKEFQADKAKLEKEKSEVEEAGRKAEARLAKHKEERERLAHSLDAAVLAAYERVSQMRGGLAVVQVREELCLGCRVKVRPQVFQEVMNGDGLRQCDSCTRFLYYIEEFEGEEAKKPPQEGAPPQAPPADAASPEAPPAKDPPA